MSSAAKHKNKKTEKTIRERQTKTTTNINELYQ